MRYTIRASALALFVLAISSGVAVAQAAPARFAYVNPQALFESAPGRAAAEEAFRKETETYRAELARLTESLNKAVQDYQKVESTLTAAQKEQRQRTLQAKQDTLQARQQALEQQATRRQNELMAPIMESVRKVLEDIRAEDGYAIIFSSEPGTSTILAADKNLDITERVVARLRTIAAAGSTPMTPTTATPRPTAGAPANAPSGVTRPKPPA